VQGQYILKAESAFLSPNGRPGRQLSPKAFLGELHEPFYASALLAVRPVGGVGVIRPPDGMGGYMFAVLSSLRAAQLMRGCVPRVDVAGHKPTVVAQMEVAQGKSHPTDDGDL
jgi:hypothetical protein